MTVGADDLIVAPERVRAAFGSWQVRVRVRVGVYSKGQLTLPLTLTLILSLLCRRGGVACACSIWRVRMARGPSTLISTPTPTLTPQS